MARLDGAIGAPEIDASSRRITRSPNRSTIEGTPAFVVGDKLVPGVVDIDTLRKLVAEVRKGG